MSDSETTNQAQKSAENLFATRLKLAGILVGIIASLATLIWILYQSLYDRNVLCSVDIDACRTNVAKLESTLNSQATQPVTVETVEVTVVHTTVVSATPASALGEKTPTPTNISYETTGNCNAAFSNAPCTYVLSEGDRWEQIAQNSPYGDNCRYPEIMNVNRRADGMYPRLSGYDSDLGRPITIMPAAPPGVYQPRIRNALGNFVFLDECDRDGFPCIFIVNEQLALFTYEQISQTVYRNNIYGRTIAQANLASDCSGRAVELELGTRLIIPKRPLFPPTPPIQ
jgi:hypothetical protein